MRSTLALFVAIQEDADRIVLVPIERIMSTVDKISENPLAPLETIDETDETSRVHAAITKMAKLLQVGFGKAGSAIIAPNLSGKGEINPMIPGKCVEAIFGFCDIRKFTDATEQLQEDVMLFVNSIASIVHRHAVESGGDPNKNIGDAFLIVWTLPDADDNCHNPVYDNSFQAFEGVIEGIGNYSGLFEILNNPKYSMQNFHVKMGFGLHVGWGIEGAIGTRHKVEASYLSPHVNLAARLEAATKQYGVTMLISGEMHKMLSPENQIKSRLLDKVTVKGSSSPIKLFGFSGEVLAARHGSTTHEAHANLLKGDLKQVHNFYNEMIALYLDGAWIAASSKLALWIAAFPDDHAPRVIADYIANTCDSTGAAPEKWEGFRALTEK